MTSHGQQLLGAYLADLTGKAPVHNHQLNGFELDLWYPDFDLAVEFNGQHHYAPVYGRQAFKRQQIADRLKREACEAAGIVLVTVKIVDLSHPLIPELVLRRMVAAYGQGAGHRRHADVCVNRHAPHMVCHNRRFEAYRHNQVQKYGAGACPFSNAKERRAVRRSLA